jgi:hypothetical protein
MFSKRIISLLMLLLMCGACAASNPHHPTFANTSPDAGTLTPVPVTLQGLPDAYTVDEDVSDAALPLTPAPGANGEAIVPLNRGSQAPFNGVLFNGPAVARVAVEFRTQQQRCTLERERDLSLFRARYDADIASLQLALNTQLRTDQVLLNSRDADIARLNRLLEGYQRQSSGPHLLEGLVWAGGGLIVGALVVGVIAITVPPHP